MPEWVGELANAWGLALMVLVLWILIRTKTPGVVPKRGALVKWILLGALAIVVIVGLMMLATYLYAKSLEPK